MFQRPHTRPGAALGTHYCTALSPALALRGSWHRQIVQNFFCACSWRRARYPRGPQLVHLLECIPASVIRAWIHVKIARPGLGNADLQLLCHGRLGQAGSGGRCGSSTRGTERLCLEETRRLTKPPASRSLLLSVSHQQCQHAHCQQVFVYNLHASEPARPDSLLHLARSPPLRGLPHYRLASSRSVARLASVLGIIAQPTAPSCHSLLWSRALLGHVHAAACNHTISAT